MEKMQSKFRPLFLLILLGVLWGSGYSLARFAVTSGVPPLGYAFWQMAGPSLLLFLYLALRSRWQRLHWRHVAYFMLIGLIGVGLPNTNMYFASRHLPSGLLSVVINTTPVFVYLIALLSGEEQWSRMRAIALILLVSGLLIILLPSGPIGLGVRISPAWVLIALISPLCFASAAVYIAKHPVELSVEILACGMLIAAWLWLCPVVWFTHSFYFPGAYWQTRDSAVLAEIFLSSVGYVVFFELLLSSGAVYYSFVNGVVAIMGVVWGQLFFSEPFSAVHIIAMVIIVSATTLIVLAQLRRPSSNHHIN